MHIKLALMLAELFVGAPKCSWNQWHQWHQWHRREHLVPKSVLTVTVRLIAIAGNTTIQYNPGPRCYQSARGSRITALLRLLGTLAMLCIRLFSWAIELDESYAAVT